MNDFLGSECLQEVVFDGSGIQTKWLLEDPNTKHFGDGGSPDIRFDRTEIFFGGRPGVYNLQRLTIEAIMDRISRLESSPEDIGRDECIGRLAEEKSRLKKAKHVAPFWSYYLVVYGLGVSNSDARLRELKVDIEYYDKLTQILDYWPKEHGVDLAKVSGEGRVGFDAECHARADTQEIQPVSQALPIACGASLKFGGTGEIVGQFAYQVTMPVVQSFAAYSNHGRWLFRKNRSAQILAHLIRTESSVTSLKIDVNLGVIYDAFRGMTVTESKSVKMAPLTLRDDIAS